MAVIVAFTTPGSFTWEAPASVSEVEVLVVAGGGGGGSWRGGGGGAGGLLHASALAITPGALLSGSVGSGGDGGNGAAGSDGQDSTFDSLTAIGGGGGGLGTNYDGEGRSGGSGGGAAGEASSAVPGSGTAGQGSAGGANYHSDDGADRAGGGGGGAGGAGVDAEVVAGGDGGAGADLSSAFGVSYGDAGWFASGGGGSTNDSGAAQGVALQGGGGDANASGDAAHGMVNTGGGGGAAGGGFESSNLGGDGGSGIVLIRYEGPPPLFNITQSVGRQNGAAPVFILSQQVNDATQYAAGTLVGFYQRTSRFEPPATILTLSQQVRQQHAAGKLVDLSQFVSRLTQATALIQLEQAVIYLPIDDWEASQVLVERQSIYVFDVGDYRVPISSAQATMRRNGQSFLQAVIPNASSHAAAITARINEPMVLRMGYRYDDNSLSPLEDIADAPFQILTLTTGPVRDTMTVSGYGAKTHTTTATRDLKGVQTRSIDANGRRRVRASIDLFLRPNHTARDSDGTEFPVGVIQYFINATGEAMEVIEDG